MESEWTTSLQSVLNDPTLTETQRNTLTFSMAYVKKHIDNWKLTEHARTNEWTMNDIYESFEDRVPSFGKNSLQMLSVEDSVIALKDFLFNHFDNNWKTTFLTICRIFDRENGKQNSVCLVGPKSCGKTWFLDGFAKLARFVGSPKNFIRGDTFSWSDCVGCRLIRFDECRIPIQAETWIEKFKEITGGQDTMVNRKYETNAIVEKTPVFMSANTDPFLHNINERPYFVPDRIMMLQLYPWRQANVMTQSKMLNPIAICMLKKELENTFE
uniref:Nonstructural protein n=1 Tax=Cygnus columbianus parvoviridae sp. TaxID=2794474 RepID=A0A8A4XD00_9VIRU|nr:MAG: nonstructural protein [Cygnus columbianus parvoviridae sp.]